VNEKDRLKYFGKPYFNISKGLSLSASQIVGQPQQQIDYTPFLQQQSQQPMYQIQRQVQPTYQVQRQVQPIVQYPQKQVNMPRLLIKRQPSYIPLNQKPVKYVSNKSPPKVKEKAEHEEDEWKDIGAEIYP
jgi:hypothetical protein